MLTLGDRERGKAVRIALFATDGMGRRVSVEVLDVAAQMLP
jgi:hypothetical protein